VESFEDVQDDTRNTIEAVSEGVGDGLESV